MEIQQIFNAIFGSLTNIIAAIVITILMLIALFGMFRKSTNHKVRHFARQSPAILTTVGIFFSFWGISIGLIGLDLNDIQNSIPKLLDGLKVKFIASLMGIGASIIVRIAQNFAVEDIVEKDSDEKIINLLADIHNVLSKNENNSPEVLLQELKQAIEELPIEFRKQTTLLDSIKSSLAGEGDASVTTQLGKLRSDMRDSLNDLKTSKYILVLFLFFSGNINAEISSVWKSCDEQYQDAWQECNDDFYGKCKFLGKKYKTSCTPGSESIYRQVTTNEVNKNPACVKQYQDARDKCNARYNGKCKYLGPSFKPRCEL